MQAEQAGETAMPQQHSRFPNLCQERESLRQELQQRSAELMQAARSLSPLMLKWWKGEMADDGRFSLLRF